jgi:hypothetical protein
MLPGDRNNMEPLARGVSRRLLGERRSRPRADRFAPTEWPPSRGPSPNPRRR